MPLFLLELLHQVVRRLTGRDEERWMGDIPKTQIGSPFGQLCQRLCLVENTRNVIEHPVIERNSGILGIIEQLLCFFEPKVSIKREDVEAGRHRIFSRNIFELKNIFDHLDFFRLDFTGLAPLIQHDF